MKVAIYCRLSEEDKNKQSETEDSRSIQNQKSMLIQYALEHQWEIYNIYSDDDYAGADRNRPQFQKLIQDAKEHKFDIVLCKTQSRFTRELELVEKYIHTLFPLWNIRFIGVVDHADTQNEGNKKARQINGLVNEWYLEDMSQNIKSVLTSKRQNGLHIGSFALYGYQKDPSQKGHLCIDPEAAQVVRNVFTLFAQGYGKTAIARMLNDEGIPNPTEYKRLQGLRYCQPKNKQSTLWRYSAIADMLTNEIYIGNMVQGKYGSVSYKSKKNKPRPKDQWFVVEGTHEAIIEKELWGKVQERIKNRIKPFSGGEIGVFAHKAKCMECGYTMRSSKNHGKYYLRCSTRFISKDVCNGSFISVENLENAILAEFCTLSEIYLNKEEILKNIPKSNPNKKQKEELETWKDSYEKKVIEYEKALKELYLDKVKGVVSEEEFFTFSKDFIKEKKRFASLLEEVENKIVYLQKKDTKESSKLILNQYIHLERLDRMMVEHFIEYISVEKRNRETGEQLVEIHWKF